MFKEKLKHYIQTHGHEEEKMNEITDLFERVICEEVKYSLPVVYEKFIEDFHEIIDEVSDEDVIMAVNNLHKKDGTTGAKWSKEEIKNIMSQFNIHEKAGKKISDMEFWFGMNYAYASHYAPNKPISVYIDLALDEVMDKNVCFKNKIKFLNEKHHKTEEKVK